MRAPSWMRRMKSFRDHWGNHDEEYEQWAARKFGRAEFDPPYG